jgi:hypothetical protein
VGMGGVGARCRWVKWWCIILDADVGLCFGCTGATGRQISRDKLIALGTACHTMYSE